MRIVQESPYRFRIEPEGGMRVPGVVFASRELLPAVSGDRSLEQAANVATLPGIVRASYAMPDVHWGYGFPIGGVAATDLDADGVVSPGGVGFDISCGVRLLAARVLNRPELITRLEAVMDRLDRVIPRGVGPGRPLAPGPVGARARPDRWIPVRRRRRSRCRARPRQVRGR